MFGKILLSGLLMTTTIAYSQAPPSEVFTVGEKFTYSVKWWFISVGKSSLEVQNIAIINNWPCYHFIGKARTKILFFFTVEDRVESYSTVDTLLPIIYEKHLREGRYKKDLRVVFDRQNNTAQYETDTFPVGPECRDVLGAFYYFRTLKFPEPGGSISVCVHTGKKNYPLLIQVLKRQKIKVPAGKFDTILIQLYPQPGFEGLFRHKGNIKIWLTDDKIRIPVKVQVKIPILGSIKMVLKKKERP